MAGMSEECWRCEGFGVLDCDRCEDGKIEVDHFVLVTGEAQLCNNVGRIMECDVCHGTEEVECPECDGNG